MNNKKRILPLVSRWIAVAIAFSSLAIISGCKGGEKGEAAAKPPTAVEVVTPERKVISDTVILTGTVEADKMATVSCNIGGNVDAIPVDVGDAVRKGQTLIRLDASSLSAQKQAADSALAMAKVQLEIATTGARPEQVKQLEEQTAAAKTAHDTAEENYARQKKLFDDGVVPQSALDGALAQRDAAKAAYESAKLSLQMAKTGARKEDVQLAELAVKSAKSQVAMADANLGYTVIRAPFDGVVGAKYVEVGEHAGVGNPLIDIVGSGARKVVVDVPATLIDQASRSSEVRLHLGSTEVPVRILKVHPSVDERTRMGKIEVSAGDAELIVGSFVEVRFTTALTGEVIALPRRCVQSPGEEPFVWIVSPTGAAAKVNVKLGAASEQEYEIVSGLTGGEQVIIAGQNLVAEGEKVDVRKVNGGEK
ncbi:MAG: efflux RND transporter periplasmic adaptor subunit [bacterium]|jgi:multidrug efflux pump subunit AcrA (membrane-fusion protein)